MPRMLRLQLRGASAQRLSPPAPQFRLAPTEIYAGESGLLIASFHDGAWRIDGVPFREAQFTGPVMLRVGSEAREYGPYRHARLIGRTLGGGAQVLAVVVDQTAWRWGRSGMRHAHITARYA